MITWCNFKTDRDTFLFYFLVFWTNSHICFFTCRRINVMFDRATVSRQNRETHKTMHVINLIMWGGGRGGWSQYYVRQSCNTNASTQFNQLNLAQIIIYAQTNYTYGCYQKYAFVNVTNLLWSGETRHWWVGVVLSQYTPMHQHTYWLYQLLRQQLNSGKMYKHIVLAIVSRYTHVMHHTDTHCWVGYFEGVCHVVVEFVKLLW